MDEIEHAHFDVNGLSLHVARTGQGRKLGLAWLIECNPLSFLPCIHLSTFSCPFLVLQGNWALCSSSMDSLRYGTLGDTKCSPVAGAGFQAIAPELRAYGLSGRPAIHSGAQQLACKTSSPIS